MTTERQSHRDGHPEPMEPSGKLTSSSSHRWTFGLRQKWPWGETAKGIFSIHVAGQLGIHMGKNYPGSLTPHIHKTVNSRWTPSFKDER